MKLKIHPNAKAVVELAYKTIESQPKETHEMHFTNADLGMFIGHMFEYHKEELEQLVEIGLVRSKTSARIIKIMKQETINKIQDAKTPQEALHVVRRESFEVISNEQFNKKKDNNVTS